MSYDDKLVQAGIKKRFEISYEADGEWIAVGHSDTLKEICTRDDARFRAYDTKYDLMVTFSHKL